MTGSSLIPDDDMDLVTRISAGDGRALEAVYDRHSAHLFSLAVRVTGRRVAAEEATQDAFLTLWRSPERYDAERGTLRNWMLSIVRNRSIDWLRREGRHDRSVPIDECPTDRLEAAGQTEDQVFARDEAWRARQLVLGLPTEQRQVVDLAYYKGLTQREIAARIGIPLGTVKGRLRLAMAKMHRELTATYAAA